MNAKSKIESWPVHPQVPEGAAGLFVGRFPSQGGRSIRAAKASHGRASAGGGDTFKKTLRAPDLKRRGRFVAKTDRKLQAYGFR